MLAPHEYARYRVLNGVAVRPDLSVAQAEVDGHRVELVTAVPVPANARLVVLRRLAEREALTGDGIAPYLAGGVEDSRTWLALGATEGPSLHELTTWIGTRRELGSAEIAARVVADVASTMREVMKRAPSLPVTGISDVRIAP